MSWTDAINAQVCAIKSHQNFSQRTHLIHPLEPNSYSGVFLSVSVDLAMFHYYTELGAKWVELVQLRHMFVPWSRIGIFCNERTRSTAVDPNSCSGEFWTVWVHLAMFRYYTELGAKWVELVQLRHKFVPRSRIGILCNEHTRSATLDPKL